jgi:hypothetical protein
MEWIIIISILIVVIFLLNQSIKQAEIAEKEKIKQNNALLAEIKRKEEAEKQRLAEIQRKKELEEREKLAELKRKEEAEKQRLAEIQRKKELEEREKLAELKRREEAEKQRLAEIQRKKELEEKERLAEIKRKEEAEKQRLAEIQHKKELEEKEKLAELKRKEEAEKQAKQRLAQFTICEKDTSYSQRILQVFENKKENFSFLDIQSFGAKQREGVHDSLEFGVALLTTEEQLLQYMFAYGKMHNAKLTQAFSTILNEEFHNQNIEIIDYGCGQGIGSVVFIDCLKEYAKRTNTNFLIQSVKLIEPSFLALQRAALHTKLALESAKQPIKIQCINKTLENLEKIDLELSEKVTVRFHIFSNILDIENSFAISRLANLIKDNLIEVDYFVCVSPYINDSRMGQLDEFMNYFRIYNTFTLISKRDTDIPNPSIYSDKDWKRYEIVFKVNYGIEQFMF